VLRAGDLLAAKIHPRFRQLFFDLIGSRRIARVRREKFRRLIASDFRHALDMRSQKVTAVAGS
jgi:hypothetical protein